MYYISEQLSIEARIFICSQPGSGKAYELMFLLLQMICFGLLEWLARCENHMRELKFLELLSGFSHIVLAYCKVDLQA